MTSKESVEYFSNFCKIELVVPLLPVHVSINGNPTSNEFTSFWIDKDIVNVYLCILVYLFGVIII